MPSFLCENRKRGLFQKSIKTCLLPSYGKKQLLLPVPISWSIHLDLSVQHRTWHFLFTCLGKVQILYPALEGPARFCPFGNGYLPKPLSHWQALQTNQVGPLRGHQTVDIFCYHTLAHNLPCPKTIKQNPHYYEQVQLPPPPRSHHCTAENDPSLPTVTYRHISAWPKNKLLNVENCFYFFVPLQCPAHSQCPLNTSVQ